LLLHYAPHYRFATLPAFTPLAYWLPDHTAHSSLTRFYTDAHTVRVIYAPLLHYAAYHTTHTVTAVTRIHTPHYWLDLPTTHALRFRARHAPGWTVPHYAAFYARHTLHTHYIHVCGLRYVGSLRVCLRAFGYYTPHYHCVHWFRAPLPAVTLPRYRSGVRFFTHTDGCLTVQFAFTIYSLYHVGLHTRTYTHTPPACYRAADSCYWTFTTRTRDSRAHTFGFGLLRFRLLLPRFYLFTYTVRRSSCLRKRGYPPDSLQLLHAVGSTTHYLHRTTHLQVDTDYHDTVAHDSRMITHAYAVDSFWMIRDTGVTHTLPPPALGSYALPDVPTTATTRWLIHDRGYYRTGYYYTAAGYYRTIPTGYHYFATHGPNSSGYMCYHGYAAHSTCAFILHVIWLRDTVCLTLRTHRTPTSLIYWWFITRTHTVPVHTTPRSYTAYHGRYARVTGFFTLLGSWLFTHTRDTPILRVGCSCSTLPHTGTHHTLLWLFLHTRYRSLRLDAVDLQVHCTHTRTLPTTQLDTPHVPHGTLPLRTFTFIYCGYTHTPTRTYLLVATLH